MARGDASTCRRQIQTFNDALRQSFQGGRVVISAGIAALPESQCVAVLAAVQAFDRFDEANDPHGEHGFEALAVAGVRVLWKIDAYDRTLDCASPDPADPCVTARVLTVMLAEEW